MVTLRGGNKVGFWGAGNVLVLDLSADNMGRSSLKKSMSYLLMIYAVFCMYVML